jgi:hypothetical protein
MARIIYPEDFIQQRQLLKDVITEDTAEGINSAIKNLLTQKGIVLADDNTAGAQAALHEASRDTFSKHAEQLNSLRDQIFDPIFEDFRAWVQYIKSLLPNPHHLADYHIEVDGKNRIVYPIIFEDRAQLVLDFIAYVQGLPPADNLLQTKLTADNVNLATIVLNIGKAQLNNTNANQNEKDAETETKERNLLWDPVMNHLHLIGDNLMKLNNKNPKKAGDWGYVVDESKRAPKLVTTNLKIGAQATIAGCTIGGTLTVLAGSAHIYKGKTTTGTPTIVSTNGTFPILKGFSTITVVNPSTTVPLKFSVLRNQ